MDTYVSKKRKKTKLDMQTKRIVAFIFIVFFISTGVMLHVAMHDRHLEVFKIVMMWFGIMCAVTGVFLWITLTGDNLE